MYRSYNKERRAIMEEEHAKEMRRMDFEARVHGSKKGIKFVPLEFDGDDDGEVSDDEVKQMFSALDERVQKQVEDLRKRAARGGAQRGTRPDDKT